MFIPLYLNIQTFYNTAQTCSYSNFMSPDEFEKAFNKAKKLSMPDAS